MFMVEEQYRCDVESSRHCRLLERHRPLFHHFLADDVNHSTDSKRHVHCEMLPLIQMRLQRKKQSKLDDEVNS